MAIRLFPLGLMLLLEPVLGSFVPASDRRAAPIFTTKRDNSCPSGNYTAPNGLKFEPFCLQNVPFSDILDTTATNMEDCMNQCAAFGSDNGQTCWGIAYNFDDQRCYYKNQSVLSTTPGMQGQTHSAFAININTAPDTACPWTNATDHSTPNGMNFEVLCDQDMPFNDFCPFNSPTASSARSAGLCPYHADNLEECMELCSQAHPVCKAVAYNPDMKEGYGNCYPKSDISASNYVSRASNPTLHMAVAVNWPTLNSSCTNGTAYMTPNNEQFTVSCNDNRPGNDLIQVHSANLSDCINTCASYSNDTTGGCVAVVYDSTLNSGWQSCWLKSADSASSTVAGNHYALKVGNAPTSTSEPTSTNEPNSASTNSSKAWIAGPIVGGITGVALIGAGILYFLRRNKSKQNQAAIPPTSEKQITMHGQQPAYASNANKLPAEQPLIHEADGLQTQELPAETATHELP